MAGSVNRQLRHMAERRQRVDDARRKLARDTADLVRLASSVGMSGPEIARELGVSHQYVYSLLREVGDAAVQADSPD